jgi:hypothetical protein
MKRLRYAITGLYCLLLILLPYAAFSEATLDWVDPPASVRSGEAVFLSFSATIPGSADVLLKDASGNTVATLAEGLSAKAGRNNFSWDGKAQGQDLPAGIYTLEVIEGDIVASAKVTVGDPGPGFLSIVPSDDHLVPGEDWSLQVETSVQATVTMTVKYGPSYAPLYEALLPAGVHDIPWEGIVDGQALPPGDCVIGLKLTDESGFSSNEEQVALTIDAPQAAAEATAAATTTATTTPEIITATKDPGDAKSPADFSAYTCEHETCFFKLPMGVMDEAAIWKAMMQPMTVVKGEQRQVVKVYAEPNEDSTAVGEVTCTSQGLHVLQTLDNGWSLVEAYSSSVKGSKVELWAGFFTGYIKTSRLETKEPNTKYGLLMDKLTQRMYVFEEGKIITELKISTGLANRKQPFNETPAGEFMIVSRTGGFWSGNMWCDMALRINGGILIHEVPCLISDDDVRNYELFERVLGQKASHGCIRVQREESAEGINMRWLWDHLKVGTRVFIWDDVGRSIPIPDAGTPLYYNPDGGQYYHSDQNCPSVKDKYLPLSPFTYGELGNDPYTKLTPCASCNPPKRQEDIEALNAGMRESY